MSKQGEDQMLSRRRRIRCHRGGEDLMSKQGEDLMSKQ
jgi:hypothetical protein